MAAVANFRAPRRQRGKIGQQRRARMEFRQQAGPAYKRHQERAGGEPFGRKGVAVLLEAQRGGEAQCDLRDGAFILRAGVDGLRVRVDGSRAGAVDWRLAASSFLQLDCADVRHPPIVH